MQLGRRTSAAGLSTRSACRVPAVCRPKLAERRASGVARFTRAAPEWPSVWDQQLSGWESTHRHMEPKIPDLDKKLATKVSKAAASYKPKFAIPPPVVSLESVAIDFLEELPEAMPRSLSERLRIVAKTQLACFLGNPNIQPKQLEFTTTDIDSAVEVAAVVANGPKGKQAVISMVACETERQMTWSRLEGLKSHWAISSAPGGRWEIPSRNFISVPGGSVNVDGAYNSKFDKHPLPQPGGVVSPDSMFTLLLALPLEGHVADGGLVFVLKSGSEGQNTRWLKDSKTGKDFFIEIKKLPNA